jgi:hypothetical protein
MQAPCLPVEIIRTPFPAPGYTEARYAAGTWTHERRVVIKAEVVRLPGREPRDNPQPIRLPRGLVSRCGACPHPQIRVFAIGSRRTRTKIGPFTNNAGLGKG